MIFYDLKGFSALCLQCGEPLSFSWMQGSATRGAASSNGSARRLPNDSVQIHWKASFVILPIACTPGVTSCGAQRIVSSSCFVLVIGECPGCFSFSSEGFARLGASKHIEDFFGTVQFQLADECHQFAESAFGKAFFLEPSQVFVGQVADGQAIGRIVLGTVFAEWDSGRDCFLQHLLELFFL